MGNQIVVMGGRGSEGQHLKCVETVTLPLQDTCKPKRPKIYQRQRSKSDASKMSVPESEQCQFRRVEENGRFYPKNGQPHDGER